MSGTTTTSNVIVENGTGIAGANAYCSTAYVDAYAAARSRSAGDAYATWATLTDAAKSASVVLVTDYLDTTLRWSGDRASYAQGLEWPRVGAFDTDASVDVPAGIVPPKVMRAAAEMAVKVGGGTTLLQDLDRGGQIQSLSLSGMSITYFQGAPATVVYGAMSLLKGLLRDDAALPPINGLAPVSEGRPGFYQGMFDAPGRPDYLASGAPAFGGTLGYDRPLGGFLPNGGIE